MLDLFYCGLALLATTTVTGAAIVVSRYGSIYRGPPALIFASPWDLLMNYLGLLLPHYEKEYEKTEREILTYLSKIWKCSEEQVLLGSSCRSVFDNFLIVQKSFQPNKNRVLATALMHSSFPKAIKFNNLELDLIDIELNTYQFEFNPENYDPSLYVAVVITHAFGRAFEIEKLVKWAKDNNITIFEDAVQAQMFPLYKGHPDTDIIVFSGGLDKIPSSFGGAPVIINNPQLRKELKVLLSDLPFQARKFRFRKLIESTFLFIIYKYPSVTFLITLIGSYFFRPKDAVMSVRKNASGFVHDRELYMTRPSYAGLVSIHSSLQKNWVAAHDHMSSQFKLFRKSLSANVRARSFPWIAQGDSDKVNDSCFYLHIYSEDTAKLIDHLYTKPFLAMIQQSWYDPGVTAPNAQTLCNKLIILPLPYNQTKLQLQTLAQTLNEFYGDK